MSNRELARVALVACVLTACATPSEPTPAPPPQPARLGDVVREHSRRLSPQGWTLVTATELDEVQVEPALWSMLGTFAQWTDLMQHLATHFELELMVVAERRLAILAPRRHLQVSLLEVGRHDALRLIAMAAGKPLVIDVAVPDEPIALESEGRWDALCAQVLPPGFGVVDAVEELRAVPLPAPEDGQWLAPSDRADHELLLGTWNAEDRSVYPDQRPLELTAPGPPSEGYGSFLVLRGGEGWRLAGWVTTRP